MPTRTVPLSKLAEQLSRKESELRGVRHAYEARLGDLRKRKEELEAALKQINTEMQAAIQEISPVVAQPQQQPEPQSAPSLPDMLVLILRERGHAMTVKELSTELVDRKYPTASTNLARMVGNRVHEMLKKGLFVRSKRKKAVALPRGKAIQVVKATRGPGKKKAAAKSSAASNGAAPGKRRTSLRSLLTELLGESSVPLKAKELVERVKATGYRSKSKKFIDVIWTALGQMDNVENVPGEGYRLK